MTTSEIERYLIREQGWDEEAVAKMSKDELDDIWRHYHEY